MKKATLYIGIFCNIFYSCKKEEILVITPPITTVLQLKIDQVINDSTIILKWSKFSGNSFQKYLIVRTASYFKNGQFGDFSEPVDSSYDVSHLSFTENKMPLTRYIYYQLYVTKDTTQPNRGLLQVGFTDYERPNSLVYGIPKDVLFNKALQKIYVTEGNKITLMDMVSSRPTLTKEFSAGIGYCSLSDFNGSPEMYVPVNDGWLEILDAVTFQLKDRIYVAGFGIGSVAAVNGKLYVSSSDQTQGSNTIKIYDRATKSLVSRTGFREQTRLIPLEGTNTEMIDISLSGIFYHQFSPAGIPLSSKQENSPLSYLKDPAIIRSFPDGSKFITSLSGTIYNKSLVFDRYIKEFANFSDFAFNNDGSLIYAAYGFQKKIDVVSYPSVAITRSYTTDLYPYKIFRDGNTLICVNRTYLNQQNSYLFIERINL